MTYCELLHVGFHRIGPLGRFDLVVAMSFFIWYILRPILPPLPEVGCPKILELQNPWGKVLERSGLRIEHFCWDVVKNHRAKKGCFFADFVLQNMVETALPD